MPKKVTECYSDGDDTSNDNWKQESGMVTMPYKL